MKNKDIQAINIINSIKMGTVPNAALADIIVGRTLEINEFNRCLSLIRQGGSTVKLIVGEYGSGKSFLLEHVMQSAIHDRCIVSKISLGHGFTFNKQEDIYYHIMHNLFNDSKHLDFDCIFETWIDQLKRMSIDAASSHLNRVISSVSKINRSFGTALFHYIKALIAKDMTLSRTISAWLMGEKNIPYEQKSKFNVIGSVDKTNSLDFLIAFTHLLNMLGYNGFVVLIDEFDLIMTQRKDYLQKALMNYRQIIDLCGNQTLINTMLVATSTKKFINDPQKGIPSYPALAQRLGKAIDPNNSCLGDLRQPIMHLTKFKTPDIDELTMKILDFYSKAFNFNSQLSARSLKKWVFYYYKKEGLDLSRLSLREYLIKLIEILDIIDQNPDNLIFSKEISNAKNEGKIVIGGRLK